MNPRAVAEMALFLVASAVGIYGFGRAFQGDGLWLAVTAVALVVLAKQMARVQDRWPRRRPQAQQSRDREVRKAQ